MNRNLIYYHNPWRPTCAPPPTTSWTCLQPCLDAIAHVHTIMILPIYFIFFTVLYLHFGIHLIRKLPTLCALQCRHFSALSRVCVLVVPPLLLISTSQILWDQSRVYDVVKYLLLILI